MPIAPILRRRLEGLRVAVDVQHLYKTDNPADRGCHFTLANGLTIWEAAAVTVYAQALASWLAARGAEVRTNDPRTGQLTGPYPRRQRQANSWGAHAYLACHLDAGGGKYAALEYPVAQAGSTLPRAIGAALVADFTDTIPSHREVPLVQGQRGWVCVGACDPGVAAVLLEPFFGDYRPAQGLLAADRLVAVGEAIAAGVGYWWETKRSIGRISGAYIAGREDRRACRRAATATERGETPKLHGFYLMGYRAFRWRRGDGLPQLEMFPAASTAAPGARLDT